ncbi:hypothetical protein [Aquimarina sp. SS2-1]|uniref:hypothetical protein n=1 Tax=Aquimarina besae TaxID=3342247 RepID=UPI0036732D04
MKYSILFLFLVISCKETDKKEKIIKDKPETQVVEKKEKGKASHTSFDAVFVAKLEGTDDDFLQELSMNWILDTKVAYKLKYDNQLCSGECSGEAILKDSNIRTEILEYPEGSYEFSFIQFEDLKEDFKIVIRIEASKENEATVTFESENVIGDCSPYEAIMLRIK